MKRFILLLFLCLLPISYGEDIEVEIPEFDVIIHNQKVEKTSTYPVFTYKGITYVPLTSDLNKGLGLSTVFDGNLHISKVNPKYFTQNFLNGNFEVGDTLVAKESPFDVYYYSKIGDDYPLLFYKDVTYLPLTWSIAHDTFKWSYRFDGDLYINCDDKKILNVERLMITPGYDNTSLSMTFTMREELEDLMCRIDDKNYPVHILPYDVLENGRTNYTYKISFEELLPDTSYQAVLYNQTHQYTHPLKTLPEDDTILAFVGDIQGYKMANYDGFRETLESIDVHNPDLIYLAGDIVDTGDKWQEWRYFEEALRGRNDMFLTCIGNHDVYGSPDIYVKSMTYPQNGIVDERNFYLDLPYARIAVWDTESYSTFDEQAKWLKDIMAVDKHKIVLMHRSVYPISYNESHIRNLADVFDACDIDMVLSGHDHIYSRTMMKEGSKDSDGVVYVIGGSGSGSKFYNAKESRAWSDFVYDDNNAVYSIVHISKDRIVITAYHEDSIIDEYTIE